MFVYGQPNSNQIHVGIKMAIFSTVHTQAGIRQRSLRKHCRVGRATELVFVLATGVMLTIGGTAQAQDWLGTANNSFGNDANWSTGTSPDATGVVTITDSSNNNAVLFSDQDVDTTTVSSTGVLIIRSGTSLDSTTTIQSAGSMTVRGTHTGSVTVETGGTTTIDASGTVTTTTTVNGGTVTNSGTKPSHATEKKTGTLT